MAGGGEPGQAHDVWGEQREAFAAPRDQLVEERPPSYALSGWWARVGALLLDGLIVWLPATIVLYASGAYERSQYINGAGQGTTQWSAHYGWISPVVFLAYLVATLVRRGRRNGQTLGKQIAGIKIVRDDGEPLTLGTVLIREGIGKGWLPALLVLLAPLLALALLAYWLVDYTLPLVEPQNRALHDLLARTHVVRAGEETRYFTPGLRA